MIMQKESTKYNVYTCFDEENYLTYLQVSAGWGDCSFYLKRLESGRYSLCDHIYGIEPEHYHEVSEQEAYSAAAQRLAELAPETMDRIELDCFQNGKRMGYYLNGVYPAHVYPLNEQGLHNGGKKLDGQEWKHQFRTALSMTADFLNQKGADMTPPVHAIHGSTPVDGEYPERKKQVAAITAWTILLPLLKTPSQSPQNISLESLSRGDRSRLNWCLQQLLDTEQQRDDLNRYIIWHDDPQFKGKYAGSFLMGQMESITPEGLLFLKEQAQRHHIDKKAATRALTEDDIAFFKKRERSMIYDPVRETFTANFAGEVEREASMKLMEERLAGFCECDVRPGASMIWLDGDNAIPFAKSLADAGVNFIGSSAMRERQRA